MTMRLLLSFLCFSLALAMPACAQTFGTPTFSGGNLGNIAANGSTQTVFRVNSSTGTVTVTAGSAVRISTGVANVTVTVSCGNQNACNTNTPRITVGTSGTPSGRAASLQNFTASSGTATVSGLTGTNPITFNITAIGRNSSKTFKLGFDLPINTTGTTGSATSGFSVTVTRANGSTTGQGSGSGNATAGVFRGISITKGADLAFGKIVRPSTGSGTVTVSTAGIRTVTGAGAVGIASPPPAAAAFTVSGEGGQSITVTVPSTFTMTKSGSPGITVTTSSTGSGAMTLSNTLGNAGTLSVKVGGSFALSSTTVTGVYSGSFTVSVQYN